VTDDDAFEPTHFAPPLEKLAALGPDEFREMFRSSPIQRARYAGFLRNVAIAMGNSVKASFREPLEKLVEFPDELVSEAARWALAQHSSASLSG
jgi:epoxyqueuosine reductase